MKFHSKDFREYKTRNSKLAELFKPREKGFVIPTNLFVKIRITKIFCYNNRMFGSINKRLVAAAKFFVAATKILFVVPNFVAVAKPFFP